MYVNTARDLEVKIMASIATQISNHIMVFATDPLISDIFSKKESADCFKIDDIEQRNIFIRLPEDKLQQWGSAVTLIINQLIRTLERRADKTTPKGKKQLPILLLLDEFARLGKVEAIKGALATLRSKAVTICLMIQSLAQLDEMYGMDARRTLLDNCPYKAILKVTDADSQRYFSELSGSSEVEKKSYSESYDTDIGISSRSTESYSLNREPIIYPHEYAKLKDIILMTPDGFCRVDKAPYFARTNAQPMPPPTKITDVVKRVFSKLRRNKRNRTAGQPTAIVYKIADTPKPFYKFVDFFDDMVVPLNSNEINYALESIRKPLSKRIMFDRGIAWQRKRVREKLFVLQMYYRVDYSRVHKFVLDRIIEDEILTELKKISDLALPFPEITDNARKRKDLAEIDRLFNKVTELFDEVVTHYTELEKRK